MVLSWSLFGLYVVVTRYLAWLGKRKTTSLESYALGDRAMSPLVFGMALAASMTSTATPASDQDTALAFKVAAAAPAVHFCFRYAQLSILTGADYTNPGLTATYGLAVSLAVAAAGLAWQRLRQNQGVDPC